MADADRGPIFIGVTVMFEALALIAVGFRLWSLQLLKRRILAHDMLLLAGFLLSTTLFICLMCTVIYGGLGQHAADLIATPQKLITFGKLLLVDQLVWVIAMTVIRLSILTLYMHIFSAHDRLRLACYIMMVVSLLWGISIFILLVLDCQPLAFNWDKTIPGGYCSNIQAAYLSAHVTNFAIDSSIAFLPAPVLWRLQMPTKRKLVIIFLFSLGLLICAISLTRIALYRLALGYDQTDFTFTAPTLLIFTIAEPSLGCIIACLPLLRPVAERFSSSAALSWVKSLTPTSGGSKLTRGTASRGKSISDGVHTNATIGGGGNNQWRRLSDDRDAIMADYQTDQRSIEMRSVS